jgi:hypothetical protein
MPKKSPVRKPKNPEDEVQIDTSFIGSLVSVSEPIDGDNDPDTHSMETAASNQQQDHDSLSDDDILVDEAFLQSLLKATESESRCDAEVQGQPKLNSATQQPITAEQSENSIPVDTSFMMSLISQTEVGDIILDDEGDRENLSDKGRNPKDPGPQKLSFQCGKIEQSSSPCRTTSRRCRDPR